MDMGLYIFRYQFDKDVTFASVNLNLDIMFEIRRKHGLLMLYAVALEMLTEMPC